MRSGYRKTLALALASLTLVAAPQTAVANAAAENLAKIEARNMGKIDAARLNKLVISASPQAAGDVVFSRDWLASQPKPSGNSEFKCLAEALYFEARGETVKGQFAVAEVISNRVKSARFPDSYCGVINQGTGRKYQCQFTYTCDGHAEVIAEPRAYAQVSKVARAALDGRAPEITDGATFYHTTAVRPSWARKFTRTARYGVHLFYRRGVQTASN
ncbi:cell wall hydrolase [Sulfitobacter albidus]|uniref:Cell wall hydrolase n=1 Tax=Sulfitobacter albidus TaxID=2829501 RepID=A0A975PN79_9RHOB|nr:cell wall hydrolase [Sulfitobacter albidus]QUJ77181.1 cell wall hydrolase [Sulfitobacter albidus]